MRLLSKSIHKGKFLGFGIGGSLYQTFDLSVEYLRSVGDVLLVIENIDLSDSQLDSVIKRKFSHTRTSGTDVQCRGSK